MNPVVLYTKKSTFVALRKTRNKIANVDSISSKVTIRHQKYPEAYLEPSRICSAEHFFAKIVNGN